jgi:NADH-quinone oxidoreductase subunit C
MACWCWLAPDAAARRCAPAHEFGFDVFLDVTAVDWPGHAAAALRGGATTSTRPSTAARPPEDPRAEATPRGAHADRPVRRGPFMERECHDMYGIRFEGNDDLRPILLYEGFVGHPLRKDYPKQQEQPSFRTASR